MKPKWSYLKKNLSKKTMNKTKIDFYKSQSD